MATEIPSPMPCYDADIHPKKNMETSCKNTSVFLGSDKQTLLEPILSHRNSAQMYGTTYRLQEQSAADGTSLAPSDPGRSTRQFPFSKHHRDNICGYKNAPTQLREKHLTTRLSPSSLRPVSFK